MALDPADVFVAIADPTRRRLLDLLGADPGQPVHSLAKPFAMTRPAISQHLRILRDAGLVVEHRVGRERRYPLRAVPRRPPSVALSHMAHAKIEPKFDTLFARLLVGFLAFMQPLGRGWARYFTWLHAKRTPRGVIATHEQDVSAASRRGGSSQLDLWNETGVGREAVLIGSKR